ncbi:glycoside hydrolase family 132 protein [Dothidotthia symphoricarpi CBS 119687]|uniref:Glycoside hydrolase family 132 protein n=1 Tax=Dothidotthia symphoricarpi CBS 119687 TaxID=1392245 RepID=A0A6A6A7Q5_9PLEO|nr:glycoside hydrolase family 132 protein [Dothidotthia symphoricarpi CBS 119687]KAF2126847.1 glycoside hydrolase family 132 protein [Dothidotthia symphoricarpi CBS 119687]
MKLHIAVLVATAAASVAKPHAQVHHHAHRVDRRIAHPDVIVYAPTSVETVVVYELNGHPISEEEVRQGIANGTLVWGGDGILSTSTNGPVTFPTAVPVPDEPKSQSSVQEFKSQTQEPVSSAAQSSLQAAPSATPESVSAPQPAYFPKTAAELVDHDGNCSECDVKFPNNKLPCNEFPYGYGAMPLWHEGLGGWSGIQDPVYRGNDGFDDIRTVVHGSCNDGSCCEPGTFCSYGCPNPYLKLSFPTKQGRTGQTVGGLYCNDNGLLEMADGALGKTLCGKGSQNMTVKVENKLSQSVSICRTDYPGTESMVFPLTVGPGETGFLANPDQAKYFFWEGKATSAHYYINKQGVPESQACTWGVDGKNKGNWGPAIFGTSWDDINMNMGFSSLKQNELNKGEPLDYSITFAGDNVVSPCRYMKSTDQYCQADECWYDRGRGCTAAIKAEGTLTLVLTDD